MSFGSVTSGNTQVVFTISQQDWDDSGLQCGQPAYIRIFDGVSTSSAVPLSIVSPNC